MLVFQHGGDAAHKRLPEKLQYVVFLNVLAKAENLQVPKQRFNVARHLSFLRVGVDDEIEPASFEIEFPVSERQVVQFHYIEANQAQRHVKGRAVGKRI